MTRNPIFSAIAFPAALAAVLCHASAAPAADGFQPSISGSVAFELQNDAQFSSDDRTEELNSLFTTIEPVLTLTLMKGLAINAGLVFEPVQDPAIAGDDRFLDDQGLFIEVLTLDVERDGLALSAGKMHVNFGIAWDTTPGVFGTDLAEEYEMAENIAFKAAYGHAFGRAGTHTVTAQTFFLDTSVLAESAFTRRKKTREGDGGPGNTGGFSSFAFSLDGGEFPDLPGFRYHAAWVHHADDTPAADDETRWAVAGEYAIAINDKLTVTPLVEYVRFSDADGTAGQDRRYLTAGVGVAWGDWNAAVSTTLKETNAPGGATTEEEQFQVSAGYVFPIGIGLDLAYKRTRNAGIDTDVFGTLVTYGYEF